MEVPKFGPVKLAAIKDLQLGFTLIRNTIIQLRVRDLQSPNTISVYLDLRRTNYIYGILPGKYCDVMSRIRGYLSQLSWYNSPELIPAEQLGVLFHVVLSVNFNEIRWNPALRTPVCYGQLCLS